MVTKPRIEMRDDFPDGFLERLARVVIEFGRLERGVLLAIKSAYRVLNQAQAYEGGLWQAVQDEQFEQRLAHLIEKYKEAYGDRPEALAFERRIRRFVDLARRRNEYIHCAWTTENGLVGYATSSRDWPGHGLDDRVEVVSFPDLENIARDIRQEAEWLNNDRERWPSLP
jgi:hypothetical protein